MIRYPADQPFMVVDGGLSTALEELGERPGGMLWTAAALVDRPEVLEAAHRSFVEAGADIVITSSYQASVPGLVAAGLTPALARTALTRTTEIARRSGAAMVAASVGPYGAFLADGSEYRGDYSAGWDEIRRFHRERLEVLVESGPDLFAIETIPCAIEAEIIVDELRRLTDLPAWVCFTCRDERSTCGGDDMVAAVSAVAGAIDAVGVNCTAPRLVSSLLEAASAAAGDRPLVVYPNHGAAWDAAHKCWIGPTGGAEIPTMVPEWLDRGVRFVGGCCGVGAAGVRAIARMRDSLGGAAS